ncbi:hypothetical protein BDR26DRAFT_864116 [Obelidium mucronatum]|nr:hypothetical protein BDR26DRAFT_864116 [Obelidium mucronatum]
MDQEHKLLLSQRKPTDLEINQQQQQQQPQPQQETSTVEAVDGAAELQQRMSNRIKEHMEFRKVLESGVEEVRRLLVRLGGAVSPSGGGPKTDLVPKPKLTQKERKAQNKKRKLEAMMQQQQQNEDSEGEEEGDDEVPTGKYVRLTQSASDGTLSKPKLAKPINTTQPLSKKQAIISSASSTKPTAVAASKPSSTSTTTKSSSKIESAFLETLNGGSLSDVEFSDFSEDDDDERKIQQKVAATKSKKEEEKRKKNRPGQRARRELYEQQYGKQANHIVNKELTLVNKIRKPAVAKAAAPIVDEKLHPSWAAKKAQKIQISAIPAGKKISFGDDDEGDGGGSVVVSKKPVVAEESLHPSWAAKKAQKLQISAAPAGKKITFVVDDNLHPSWAAKKAQKLQISAAPAGKRIKFGGEGESEGESVATKVSPPQKGFNKEKRTTTVPPPSATTVVDEKLHPSWAAKKKQSLAIGNSSGKKIVFGDD